MIGAYQQRCQARVDAALEQLFDAPSAELARLYQAMRYSVVNGGKRVRPLARRWKATSTEPTAPPARWS